MKLPGYQIDEEIYTGSRSRIYRARDADGRPCILKELAALSDEQAVTRFLFEHEVLRDAGCRHTVGVYDLIRTRNTYVMVIEDFGAISLDRLIHARGPMTVDRFLSAGVRVIRALAELHDAGLVHHDISPANIVMNPVTGRVKLIDLGLASRASRERVSQPGMLMGTPAYVSPEQSGRAGLLVDGRSDIYSLGATFYFLLTGRPPFEEQEPMELIHAHLARQPERLDVVVGDLPRAIALIVEKMLAKDVDDRYQSCASLLADMETCNRQWMSMGAIKTFKVGSGEIRGGIRMPQKLYGREAELEVVARAMEAIGTSWARSERPRVLAIHGEAGVGKTALLDELQRMVAARRGLVARGRFAPEGSGAPHGPVTEAMRSLLGMMLTESEVHVEKWREGLREKLGDTAAWARDQLTELDDLLGPEEASHARAEGADRFPFLVRSIMEVVAEDDRPSVLFLDNFHLVDEATATLVADLCSREGLGRWLVVPAFRDENGSAQEVSAFLEPLAGHPGQLFDLPVRPLAKELTIALINGVLGFDHSEAFTMGRILFDRLGGNPRTVIQAVTRLHEGGALAYDEARERWTLDEAALADLGEPDSVQRFTEVKTARMARGTRELLWTAALLGERFSAEDLAALCGMSLETVRARLAEPIDAGLIAPVHGATHVDLCFVHEQYRIATMAMLTEQARREKHIAIGRYLLGHLSVEEVNERAAEIVAHFSPSSPVGLGDEERVRLAELELLAATGTPGLAPARAISYLARGLEYLGPDGVNGEGGLRRELTVELALARYRAGEAEVASVLFEEALGLPQSDRERLGLWRRQAHAMTVTGRYGEVLALGRDVLARFDEAVPDEAVMQTRLIEEITRLKARLAEHGVARLGTLPPASDALAAEIICLMADLCAAAMVADPNLLCYLMCRAMNLVYTHGMVSRGPYLLASLGRLCPVIGIDYRDADALGELGMRLCDRFDDPLQVGRTALLFGFTICQWTRPLAESEAVLTRALETARSVGDYQYAGYLGSTLMCTYFMLGVDLDALATRMIQGATMMQAHRNHLAHAVASIAGSTVLALTAGPLAEKPKCLRFSVETKMLATIEKWFSLIVAVHLGEHERGHRLATEMEDRIQSLISGYAMVSFHFYAALALSGSTDLPSRAGGLRRHADALAPMAEICPTSYAAMLFLVRAELARSEGEGWSAVTDYDRAHEAARACDQRGILALVHRCFARFWEENGQRAYARHHLRESHRAYRQWRAEAPARALEEAHPWLMSGSARVGYTTSTTSSDGGDVRGAMTALAAIQSISGNTDIDSLLRDAMRSLIVLAGARKGAVVLDREMGPSVVVTGSSVDADLVTERSTVPLDEAEDLPTSLILYVLRRGELRCIQREEDRGLFAHDPYLSERRPRSVLCIPLPRRDRLSGVLYLENDLVTRAFTEDRLAVLEVLSMQVSVSLENAYLHESLVAQMAGRKEAEQALGESEERFSLFMRYLPGMAFMKDERFRFLYLNKGFDSLYGLDASKLVGRGIHQLTTPEEAARVTTEDKAVLASNQPLEGIEDKITVGDHTNFFLTTKFPIPRAGKPPWLGSISIDITALKETEAALEAAREELEQRVIERTSDLHQANQLLGNVLDRIPLSVFWKDLDFRFQGCNRNFAQDAGFGSLEDIIGKRDEDLGLSAAEAMRYRALDLQVIESGRPVLNTELEIAGRDGRIKTLLLSRVPLRNVADEVTGVLGVYLDITDRKTLEEMERRRRKELDEKNRELERVNREILHAQKQLITQEKMASLGAMAAGVAHEIRNPLNFVQNMAVICVELVDELGQLVTRVLTQLPEDERDEARDIMEDLTSNVEVIHKHGQRAAQIVQSINQLAGGGSGKRQRVRLNAVVAEYVELAVKGKKESGMNIDCHYDPEMGEIDVVSHNIGRVVINLVNNAMDAVAARAAREPGHRPLVTVTTHRSENDAVITVRDNGTGITETDRAVIFDPLFTTKPSGQGNIGMGLSLCYDIVVQEHGGNLDVSSEVDRYTEMRVTLPLGGVDEPEQATATPR